MKGFRLAWMVTSLLAGMVLLCGSALAQSSDALVVDQNGKVGIGTISPGANLDIRSSGIAAEIYMGGAAQSSHTGIKFETDMLYKDQWIFAAGSGYGGLGGPGSLNLFSRNGLISLSSGTLPNMLTVNAGKVGIGTIGPQANLDIRSSDPFADIYMGGASQSNHTGIKFETDIPLNDQWIWSAGSAYYAYGGPGSLNIYSHLGLTSISNSTRVNALVVNEGNVGIGTTYQFGGGQGVLSLHNAVSNPTSAPIDGALFYASGGAMYVYDANGNETILSPHPSSEIEQLAEQSDLYPLFGKSTNPIIGKEIVIDKGKAFRLLQTLFPQERFIWYQDVPKIDITAIQKEEWKKNWITENTKEPEVSKDEALEVVEVSIEDTKKVISEKIAYALEGRNVIEVRTPVYAKTPEQKWQLKKGARFDTNTGKFFMRKEPTEEEVEAAASQHFQLVLKKWIRDRM